MDQTEDVPEPGNPNQSMEDLLTPQTIIKEEEHTVNIKEEPIEDELTEIFPNNQADFVDNSFDFKKEEPFSDEEKITEDDAVNYLVTTAPETEFVDVGQELLKSSEIKTEETGAQKECELWRQQEIDPWKLSLTSLSFMNAASQTEKHYQIKMKPSANEFKDYYILTSDTEHNDMNTKWRLFIPVTSQLLPAHQLQDIAVTYFPQGDLFNFKYKYNELVVKNIEDLPSFMQGILGRKNLLVSDQYLQRISRQFEAHFKNGNQLIPTFTTKADGSLFIFQASKLKIGDEKVPKISEANYANLMMLTPPLLCKPKLTINGVPYQQTSPSVKLLSTVCEQANTASGVDHDISDIKDKYERGQTISDEELDPLIKALESKVMKTFFEKQELTRLKDRRRTRKSRQKMSEEQVEANRKQARERKRALYHLMDDEEKEALRKQVREQKKARYHQMSDEEKEVMRKKVREQKKARYHQMSEGEKEAIRKRVNEQKKERYHEMNHEQKEELWEQVAEEENVEKEIERPWPLGNTCRGCGKVMERLLKHLKSKKGEECMTKYTEEEIDNHYYFVQIKKRSKYNNKLKEKANASDL